MKTSWPLVEVSFTRAFTAQHSLPNIGVARKHSHSYEAECGYAHEIRPWTGCSKPLAEIEKEVDAVIKRLEFQNLNELMPLPPTAEVLACWILANLVRPQGHHSVAEYWGFVSIKAYDGFRARVERRTITSAWLEILAGKHHAECTIMAAGKTCTCASILQTKGAAR